MAWVGHAFVPWCMQVQALGTQKEQLQKRVIEVERERGSFLRHMEELRRHSTTLQEDNGRLLTELDRLRQAMKQVGSVKVLVKKRRRTAMPWRVGTRAWLWDKSCDVSRHSSTPHAPVLTDVGCTETGSAYTEGSVRVCMATSGSGLIRAVPYGHAAICTNPRSC